ncbi:MAG: hypothetical protein AAF614_28310 [Chloroflexota bacterium]
MQQPLIINLFFWLTAVYQSAAFPSLTAGIFILFLLVIFTIFIVRSRDHNDYNG